ncbi:DUF1707 and DUF4870 domain-containing protein [Nocardiopsis quinghaiensis]|uniref:DUF1707 and DUF4870 domain-containing protein n=1 Tax=Nocardiopsis quinghaiensis TaxID=464995 RepID=UPI0012385218|nr:DUF1707 and DUF4870 domain-containing protein [Nocardiopsis quinghaiensis]
MQDPQYPARRAWEPQARPQIRLTDAERDDVIGVLQEAFSRGQLDEEEFGERTEKAMRAKFGADLAPLTEDLGLSQAGAPRSAPAGPFGAFSGQGRTDSRTPLPSTQAERVMAAVGHSGNYFFPVIAPLVTFLLSSRLSPYVRRQAMESLNFQIFCFVTGTVSVLLSWLIAPLLVTLAVVLGWTVLPAVASIASLMGRNWRYPMLFRVVKDD